MYAQHMLQLHTFCLCRFNILSSCHILTLIHACLKVCLNNVQYILFVIALSLKNPTCKRLNNEDCLISNYSNAQHRIPFTKKHCPFICKFANSKGKDRLFRHFQLSIPSSSAYLPICHPRLLGVGINKNKSFFVPLLHRSNKYYS